MRKTRIGTSTQTFIVAMLLHYTRIQFSEEEKMEEEGLGNSMAFYIVDAQLF